MAADSFTALLGLIKQGTGNNNNTWGALLNTGDFDEIDLAIAGRLAIATTGGTTDLSASPPPAGPSGAIYAILHVSGTLVSNAIIQVPNLSKIWLVNNACVLGAFTLTVKTPAGAASVAIPVGFSTVWCDGNNVVSVGLSSGILTTQLLGASGTLGAPGISFTADPASGMALLAASKPALIGAGGGLAVNGASNKASAAPAVSAAGSNYAVGDKIYLAGGTFILPVVVTVATLSGTGVATVTLTQAGLVTSLPANPVAQGSTSGGGSGATFTVTWTAALEISDASDATALTKMGVSAFAATLLQKVDGPDFFAGLSTNLPLPVPQGYLTPTTNTPVILSDSISATGIFYTPKSGAYAVIHNGLSLIPYQFAQMQLTLTASQAALGIYDIFLAWNGGSPVIGTGPSWAAGTAGSVTAGSCARGSGAGGTALARLNGVPVNAASMSLIWNTGSGNTTITVAANQGIYLGSIFIDAAAGQVTNHLSYGQSRKRGIYNAYNREELILKAGDPTANWAYATAVIRPSNNAAANSVTVFCGLAESRIPVDFIQTIALGSTGGFASNAIGIGWNSTTATSGLTGGIGLASSGGGFTQGHASFVQVPSLGINVATCLENGLVSDSFDGTEAGMLLTARWFG